MTIRQFISERALKVFPYPKPILPKGQYNYILNNKRNAFKLGADDMKCTMEGFSSWLSWKGWKRWDDGKWRIRFDDKPTTYDGLFHTYINEKTK